MLRGHGCPTPSPIPCPVPLFQLALPELYPYHKVVVIKYSIFLRSANHFSKVSSPRRGLWEPRFIASQKYRRPRPVIGV